MLCHFLISSKSIKTNHQKNKFYRQRPIASMKNSPFWIQFWNTPDNFAEGILFLLLNVVSDDVSDQIEIFDLNI